MRGKIAVIGVHGVGEQVAGDTAQAIMALLQCNFGPSYLAFTERHIDITVQAKDLNVQPMPADIGYGFDSVFHETAKSAFAAPGEPAPDPNDDCGVEFTRTLLDGGEAYRTNYQTTFWEGAKRMASGEVRGVHIYEMYWSDLSHGGDTLAVLKQFLQLVMHLASIGRLAAASLLKAYPAAALESGTRKAWECFYRLNAACYFLLSMPILLGNLWFLLLGVLFVMLMPQLAPAAAVVAGAAAALLLGAWVMHGLDQPRRTTRWCAIAVVLGGGSVALLWLAGSEYGARQDAGLTILLFAGFGALAALGHALAAAYEVTRPKARRMFWIVFVIALAIGVFGVCLHGLPQALPSIFRFSCSTSSPPPSSVLSACLGRPGIWLPWRWSAQVYTPHGGSKRVTVGG